MKTLYFDCFSGAAGDMILAALLDAGASEETVRTELEALRLEGWRLEIRRVTRGSINAVKADVTVGSASHPRSFKDIHALIESAGLATEVKRRAMNTFELLARAEATVHGTDPEDAHFHEVGAVDAIVDIVGASAALQDLACDHVVTSAIATGRGTARSAHGVIPVPAPATLELLKGAVLFERGDAELVTPTGAAILAAATDVFGAMPPLRLAATGYGAGSRDHEVPNVVRVIVGESERARGDDSVLQVEANIDDMNPELFPHVIEALFAAGAHDAWVTPVVMKKGRPGFTLSALAPPQASDRIVEVFLLETTTLGVRTFGVERDVVPRTWIEVAVAGEPVRVKLGRRGADVTNAMPEYEDARRAAKATGLPLKDVYAQATAAATAELAKLDTSP